MYLALRWLVGLAFVMWVALCCIDFYDGSKINQYQGFTENLLRLERMSNTHERPANYLNRKNTVNVSDKDTSLLHYGMFFAGALAVAVFNRKNEIVLYTRLKIIRINICATNFLKDSSKLKRSAIRVSIAIAKYLFTILEYCKKITRDFLTQRKALKSHYKIHLELMNKLKEYKEERKKLGEFLIFALRENKNIRMKYQMETISKNRLLRYIEDTQKQIKENHSKYINIKHLYMLSHQENIFLKSRLQKLCKDKEEAVNNLTGLINEVNNSKNFELKAYCARLIVGSRDNLLNSDVNAEIQKFLQETVRPMTSYQNTFEYLNAETDSRITHIQDDEGNIVPLISDAPKLKGLPGECIWTVKDKDGIIEKLYEYDYEAEFDNGDTIRRIRKYSVYQDNECLLDFENSKTALRGISSSAITLQQEKYIKVEYPLTSHRFLTGSQAFQKFLQDNQNFMRLPTSQKPALL